MRLQIRIKYDEEGCLFFARMFYQRLSNKREKRNQISIRRIKSFFKQLQISNAILQLGDPANKKVSRWLYKWEAKREIEKTIEPLTGKNELNWQKRKAVEKSGKVFVRANASFVRACVCLHEKLVFQKIVMQKIDRFMFRLMEAH